MSASSSNDLASLTPVACGLVCHFSLRPTCWPPTNCNYCLSKTLTVLNSLPSAVFPFAFTVATFPSLDTSTYGQLFGRLARAILRFAQIWPPTRRIMNKSGCCEQRHDLCCRRNVRSQGRCRSPRRGQYSAQSRFVSRHQHRCHLIQENRRDCLLT
jgi:hypothetical protein